MAKENPSWGYDRIVGVLANLGRRLSDQTVGNILRRHGLSPAPKRKQTVSWKDFIRSHRDVLVGMDFFTTEVLTLKGLLTYYVLFFIHLETRRVSLVGFTPYPDQEWMEQQARNMTMEEWGSLRGCRYLLHDRDTKFCESFRELIESGNVDPLRLPARSPNLNSYAERWVRSVKEECRQSTSWLESLRCGEPCSNICCITMKSGTIRARKIAYCFLFRRRREGKWEQSGVENDWAAC